MTRRIRKTRKVNLRAAYNLTGYSSDYAWFVREKVIPIIGASALHPLQSAKGSREREWAVTARNYQRVVKTLGLDQNALRNATKKEITPEDIAQLLIKMVQPADPGFPLVVRVPVHPISNNSQYKAVRGRMVSTDLHTRYKREFSNAINSICPDTSGVDFTKPVEVHMHFGHRESSNNGFKFDRNNFQKAAIDELFIYIGRDDSLVHKTSMSGEFVDSYEEGFIEFRVRNI